MGQSEVFGYELTVHFALLFGAAVDELHENLTKMGFDDVRPAHGFVFQRLTPSGATGVEIAQHMGITKQAASVMIDYLEEHQYVTREPNPADKRGKIVQLTDRGWACIRAVESIFTTIEQRWVELIGEHRMQAISEDLRKIARAQNERSPLAFRPVW